MCNEEVEVNFTFSVDTSAFIGFDATRNGSTGSRPNSPVNEMCYCDEKHSPLESPSYAFNSFVTELIPRNQEKLRVYKPSRTLEKLRRAVEKNDFMQNLDATAIDEFLQVVHREVYPQGTAIIQEGQAGEKVHIIEDGTVEISKSGTTLCKLEGPVVVGELAILYNCTRTATVTAQTACQSWVADRSTFQSIMIRNSTLRRDKLINSLKKIPEILALREKSCTDDNIDSLARRISEGCEDIAFGSEEFILRQGDISSRLYVVLKGHAVISKTKRGLSFSRDCPILYHSTGADDDNDEKVEPFASKLESGCWFGADDIFLSGPGLPTTLNGSYDVLVGQSGCVCAAIDQTDLQSILSDYSTQCKTHNEDSIDSQKDTKAVLQQSPTNCFDPQFANVKLNQIKVLDLLGVGAFGRVELVCIGELTTLQNNQTFHIPIESVKKTYALKRLIKHQIVEANQQSHVLLEKEILLCSQECPFIVKLFKTFHDRKFVYMLMEACLGGELWTLLRIRGSFDELSAKFYCACVFSALSFLHSKSVCFRDIKPENILLDKNGYVKLIDFGFARTIDSKTFTFCGTPEYLAPEVILNKGHDCTADLWSLGILVFELVTGGPPFYSDDPLSTYKSILKGIDSIEFPTKKMSKWCRDFVKRLCKSNPPERLGAPSKSCSLATSQRQVKKHKWFDSFSWDHLEAMTLKAPFIPKIASSIDTSNFELSHCDELTQRSDQLFFSDSGIQSELSGWDKNY